MARWFSELLTASASFKAGVWVALSAISLAITGCDAGPELSEWTLADHDHQVEVKKRRSASVPKTHAPPSQRNQLIDVTWTNQCASCHGKRGRGDGPSSTMVKARDLTSNEWQTSVTDEAIAEVIRKGREKMPAFNLPDSIIQGLVAHVREMAVKRNERRDDGAGSAEPTTAPASSSDAPEEKAPSPSTEAPAQTAPPAGGSAPER